MFDLPAPEIIAFLSVLAIYFAASILGVLQLFSKGRIYNRLLSSLVSAAVALEVLILILRAVELKAVPLTGLFESLILLTIVFGLVYLFSLLSIRQVWFGSIMVWVILAVNLLAAVVAEHAAEVQPLAQTPWAIVHAVAMVLGGTSITFAMTTAFLFLLGRRKLKHKQVMKVLGRVPSLQKLERMNLLGIKLAFVFITVGIISGLAMVFMHNAGFLAWITDSKVISTIAVWAVLVLILILNNVFVLQGKTTGCITIIAFALILFAIFGVTILDVTRHRFS